ncbi:hypothetical protein ISF_06423 [Cordyceps fumosorosea ARSEF 2679]|uniref:BHLH domain-containing protein n=1 Tax=Cordyceps fumosorosea (strain ARSEF 2679) TaxID=1081104 RepID=A0A167SCE7_CORFA|nr:hypothetical protein ISF_06423 [Cordyceps fumosorosea ARSEF 2679]OAA59488.1 hypothetical protein ISF_06423 [Cordyceps fumosorosea ARSEF 2679]
MSTDENASQLALDDGPLSFNDVFTTTAATPEQPLIASDITKSLFDSNGVWDFQGTSSLESYNLTTPSNSASQPDFMPQPWSFQAFENQPQTSSASSQSALSAGVNPINLFSNSSDPNGFTPAAASEDGRASNASSRQPVAQPPRFSTSLAPAVEEKLRNIAMPGGLPRQILHMSSPDSSKSETKAGIISSPEDASEARQHESRKRKVSSEPEEDDDAEDEDKPVKKTAHNMIEKRYRTNINDKIAALRDSVPSLRIMSKSARGEDTTQDREELHGLTPAHKLNKATVLSKATEYIRHLEKRNTRLLEENNAMQARIAAFEKLFMAGAMNGSISSHHPPPQMPFPQEGQSNFLQSPIPQQENGETPAGMIQVPDDMRRILAAQMAAGQPYPVPQQQAFQGANPAIVRQQQIQQQQVQQQQGAWSNASPYFGKLMVGSLAGLMIIEAFREDEVSNETPEGRGLAAIPVQLLRTAAKGLDFNYHGYHVHTSIQSLLFLGVFLWIFVPSLFQSSDSNPKKRGAGQLRAAPSMAAPIHVRRQAWATAIQTVWVPRHNFFLEVAALLLKMAKLSLRNAIGWNGYQMLTGTTQEEETARIKAWSIALDSQLAGGDSEVCTRRLLLTLMASDTLPDTPVRLMLKALHIRVLLWNLGQTRFVPANMIAAKIARSRWNSARQLNQLLLQLRTDPTKPHEDELPEHLVALVERDCDEVLTDAVVHRAYNLAFHKDTTDGAVPKIDGMDSVVYDIYVGTPLDAAAAWCSTCLLHDVLTEALDTKKVNKEDLDTALNVAPPGSIAKLRASLACATLVDESRGASIASSLTLLGTERQETPKHEAKVVIGSSIHASNPDLLLTLRSAVALGQLSRGQDAAVSPCKSLRVIEASLRPVMASTMTLLGFTAVMTLLERVMAQRRGEDDAVDASLEKLAATLRVWIGGPCGSNAGIDADTRAKVVERCLTITKSLVGMDVDTGYGTLTDVSDDDSG